MDFRPHVSIAGMLLTAYVTLGAISNVRSLLHRKRTGRTLTPVNPVGGLVMMLFTAVAAVLHLQGQRMASALLFVILVLIAYAGVYRHVCRADPAGYASAADRIKAIAVNLIGVFAISLTLIA